MAEKVPLTTEPAPIAAVNIPTELGKEVLVSSYTTIPLALP